MVAVDQTVLLSQRAIESERKRFAVANRRGFRVIPVAAGFAWLLRLSPVFSDEEDLMMLMSNSSYVTGLRRAKRRYVEIYL
jgi:hypothetical protein